MNAARRLSLLSLLLLVGASGLLLAQTTLSLSGPATARPGNTITVNLSLSPGGSPTSAFQWFLSTPSGYLVSVTTGDVGTSASKSVLCSADNLYCILYGMNNTVVGSGTLAVYNVSIPVSASAGPAAFSLSELLGASPSGTPVTLSPGPVYNVGVLALQDINGDGKVDRADVLLMFQQMVASRTNPAACLNDQNGDGHCDLFDVVIVILKAIGI
jgi:hypothetical protein